MTLSMTSLVPPSIELALVRSQPRALAPPLVSSLSHSSASLPPPDITNSWRRLLSSVPTYFIMFDDAACARPVFHMRLEEHTSELQSLMRLYYSVFCFKKTQDNKIHH